MKKLLLFLIVLSTISTSCNDRDDNLESVNIRVENVSAINFNTVTVGDEALLFENVAADSYSDYQEAVTVYMEDIITVEADSTSYTYKPEMRTDSLPIGLYTYKLSITEEGALEMEFIID